MILSRNGRRAINAYGTAICQHAYMLHRQGYGARYVGAVLGLTTNQADAAINAGREHSNIVESIESR